MAPGRISARGKSRFRLGSVAVTAHAQDILSDTDINAGLARHQSGDWGEVTPQSSLFFSNILEKLVDFFICSASSATLNSAPMTEGGANTRNEKRFLVDSLSHLLYGGLLIYIIPYYRLAA